MKFRCDPALRDRLPAPIPARAGLPDWLRAMAPRVPSAFHGRPIRTVKQCPPFVDAMAFGFLILLPCDLLVDHGEVSWNWDLPAPRIDGHPRAPVSFHVPAQLDGAPFGDGRHVALKFNSFWTIELEPGWSLFAAHPFNRDDLPFRTLTGLVDADRFVDAGINFPALWTRPEFSGRLAKGTPIAQCFPVPRAPLELDCDAMSADQAARYSALVDEVLHTPGVYRRRFRAKRAGR